MVKKSPDFPGPPKHFLKLFLYLIEGGGHRRGPCIRPGAPMLEFDARKLMNAATALHAAAKRDAAAAEPTAPAWSPIVVAGTVRMIEFGLTTLIGLAVYLGYVVPIEGFAWRYVGAVLGIAGLAMLAFQTADIYQVQAFRGYEKQYFRLASAWSVVFLIAIGVTFFAKMGDHYSRVWLGSFYVVGLVVLIAFRRSLFVMVRRWTREGRLARRTVVVGADERGDALVQALSAQRDSDVHIVGVFDDRGDDRAPTMLAGQQKLGTVDDLVEFARKTRIDLVIFALPISAEGRILQRLKKRWLLPDSALGRDRQREDHEVDAGLARE